MPKDDLSGQKLDNVGLEGENMERSDLSKSSLRHSNLKGAKLRGANLAGADLTHARLQDADVTGADLHDADLTGADLDGVDLGRAASTEGLTIAGATGLPDGGAPLEDPSPERARPVDREVRAGVLARLDLERTAWESLIEEIPPAWIDLPNAIGAWSVKDVIAHLSAWRQPYLDDFQAAVQGTAPPASGWPWSFEEIESGSPDEVEARTQAVNEWIHERNARRAHDQVLAEVSLQWTLLRAVVEIMPDRLLTDPEAFSRLDGQTLAERLLGGQFFSHFHDEHEPGIRAWLSRMQGRPAAG